MPYDLPISDSAKLPGSIAKTASGTNLCVGRAPRYLGTDRYRRFNIVPAQIWAALLIRPGKLPANHQEDTIVSQALERFRPFLRCPMISVADLIAVVPPGAPKDVVPNDTVPKDLPP